MRETRQQTIVCHVTLAMAATTMRCYATDVARIYAERTPVAMRDVEFHQTRDPYADQRANAQIVQRYIDGRSRMPVEIEEALVLALPEPFRGECKRELAARYGDLAAPIPSAAPGAPMADAGMLMAECGQALVELSQSYRDGVIVHGESGVARDAINKLTDVIAQATGLRERLIQALAPIQLRSAGR
ncbi:MAG: hypothetical protein P4L92_22915 [Rudaea sp.]|nr:hypothetical protein [Rudaea sp.]